MPYEHVLARAAIDERARRASLRGEDTDFGVDVAGVGVFSVVDLSTLGPFTFDLNLTQTERAQVADVATLRVAVSATETAVGVDAGSRPIAGAETTSVMEAASVGLRAFEVGGVVDTNSIVAALSRGETAAVSEATVVGHSDTETGSIADAGSVVATFHDDFNRTVNPLGNGWTDRDGVFQADGAQAVVATNSAPDPYDITTQDLAADGTIQVTLSTLYASGLAGIVFRWSDNSNFWMWAEGGSSKGLIKYVAGSPSTPYVSVSGGSSGDVLKVVLSGNSIQVYLNGSLLHTETDSFNSSAIKHGLICDSILGVASNTKWDDFDFA